MQMLASKRAMASSHAAACRELWFKYHTMACDDLRSALNWYENLTSDYMRQRRPENIQRVDLGYLRMIQTELKHRKTREFCSSDYCADNGCRWV